MNQEGDIVFDSLPYIDGNLEIGILRANAR